jgi:hypothetical protein
MGSQQKENQMGEYTPEYYGADEAPEKKSRTGLIIAIVVVVVLLCCCCVALLAGGWFYGDEILRQLGITL